jgi:hypothetical protein
MRTLPRVMATAFATTALIGSAGTAAHAQTDNLKDRATDVIHYENFDDEDGKVLSYRDSSASGVDLRGMRLKHGKKSVSVNLKFANLSKNTQAIVMFRLDGKSEPQRFLFNVSSRSGLVMDLTSSDEGCTVPLKTKTGRKGTIHAVIDRECLGDPVKVKATAFVMLSDDMMADDAPYDQDALSPTRVRGISWTKWLRSS